MMQALYTMVFEDFLKKWDNSPEWTKVKNMFAQFPSYQFEGEEPITVYNLFVDRFRFREIGAETESLFTHFVEDRTRELLVKYQWKLNTYNAEYSKLMSRSTSLESDGEDNAFLFPANTTAQKLASRTTFKRNTGALISAPSQPELLQLALNVRDLYIDVINDFEPVFLGVY